MCDAIRGYGDALTTRVARCARTLSFSLIGSPLSVSEVPRALVIDEVAVACAALEAEDRPRPAAAGLRFRSAWSARLSCRSVHTRSLRSSRAEAKLSTMVCALTGLRDGLRRGRSTSGSGGAETSAKGGEGGEAMPKMTHKFRGSDIRSFAILLITVPYPPARVSLCERRRHTATDTGAGAPAPGPASIAETPQPSWRSPRARATCRCRATSLRCGRGRRS